jgi:hypothetical protein
MDELVLSHDFESDQFFIEKTLGEIPTVPQNFIKF